MTVVKSLGDSKLLCGGSLQVHPVQEVVRETEAVDLTPLFHTVLSFCRRHRHHGTCMGCMSGDDVFEIGCLLEPSPGVLRSN